MRKLKQKLPPDCSIILYFEEEIVRCLSHMLHKYRVFEPVALLGDRHVDSILGMTYTVKSVYFRTEIRYI